MKLINKLLFFLFLAVGTFYKADVPDVPSPPPGGGGRSGLGTLASPIDMYVYALAAVGLLLIIFYNKLKQRKLA